MCTHKITYVYDIEVEAKLTRRERGVMEGGRYRAERQKGMWKYVQYMYIFELKCSQVTVLCTIMNILDIQINKWVKC